MNHCNTGHHAPYSPLFIFPIILEFHIYIINMNNSRRKTCKTRGKENTMINKITNKIPSSVMLMILLINSIIDGILVSITNVNESKIVNGFTVKLFVIEILCYGTMLSIVNYVGKIFNKSYRNRIQDKQYCLYLDRVLNSKMTDIQKLSTGKVFDTVVNVAQQESTVRLYIISLLPTIMPFSVLIYKEMKCNFVMGIISILCVGLSFLMIMVSDKLFQFNQTQKSYKARLQEITVDNFMNAKTIKFLGVNSFAMNRLKEWQDRSRVYMIQPNQLLWFRLADVIGYIPLIVNIWLGRHDTEMIALIVLSNWTLDNMCGHLTNIGETLIELNAQKDIIKDLKGNDDSARNYADQISLSDVCFDYGKDSVKFYIDSLNIKRGDRILITGESGEGKSSLANLLAGAIKPTTGEVPNINVFYVWQETECLADTLMNNIIFDNPYELTESDILGYLDKVGLKEWFFTLKDGFNTNIGEKGCKLSSGQKQRINIIRCLIEMEHHPRKLFILDEITSNLDEYTKQRVIEAFGNMLERHPEIMLIAISHNDGFERLTNRHINVENHAFVEQI